VAVAATLALRFEVPVRVRTHLALERLRARIPAGQLPAPSFSALGTAVARASSSRGGVATTAPVEAEAARILSIGAESSSPDVIAARAAALAVRRETGKAVSLLEESVTHAPDEPRLWSDLAAAYLETGRPLRALVTADRALRLDGRFVPALHNRALTLERLGLSTVAATAWNDLREAAGDPQWSAFVEERLRHAETQPERLRWRTMEKDLLAAAAAGDDAAVRRIAGDCPYLARVFAEGVYLGRWAAAFDTDPGEAARWLRVARATGAALRSRGETLLAEAVDAIDDAAASDPRRAAALAEGHRAYFRGRTAYVTRDYAVAEGELREAARLFGAGRSPMEHVARVYVASVFVNLQRFDDASKILSDVLARTTDRHPALTALAEQLLVQCDIHRGRWNAAAVNARRSAERFADLGEVEGAATSEASLAAVLDVVGQRERGWEVRLASFATASASGSLDRVSVAVASAVRAAMRAREWDLALSLLEVEETLAAGLRVPVYAADRHVRRARVQHARGVLSDRDAAAGRARAAIGAISDLAERSRQTIEVDAAEAVFVRDSEPARAIELLDRAVRFCETANERMLLPGFLLERGRAHLRAGSRRLAWRDFSAALDELEAQRGAIADLKLRARILDTAGELFDEAIALQVREGNAEEAFRVAERARARELLDSIGGGEPRPLQSSWTIADRLDPETLLLQYAVLPGEVVIFAIRRNGLRMHRVGVPRERLASHAALSECCFAPSPPISRVRSD
jgi:tetratricopeptide (TPR) repeat protein